MEFEIYMSNLDPTTSKEDVEGLVSQIATLKESEELINQRTGEPREAFKVVIELQSQDPKEQRREIWDVLEKLNGQKTAEGRWIYASPYVPGKTSRTLNKVETAVLEEAQKKLNEKEKQPVLQLKQVIQLAGISFTNTLLKETLEIEENGGMMVLDGSRRRTTGGIFFYLARGRVSPRVSQIIFTQRKSKQQEDKKQSAPKQKQRRTSKPQPSESSPPQPLKTPSTPPTDPDLKAVWEELQELQSRYKEAQSRLEELKQQSESERKTGLFKATREVVNLQKQITALQKQYPELV